MRKISIRERLILYFVLLSVISITIISLFSIFEAQKGITDRTFHQLILYRDLRREQIQEFFKTRQNELASLAASQDALRLAAIFDGKDGKNAFWDPIFKNHSLLDLVADSEFCKSIYFVNTAGEIFSIAPPGMHKVSDAEMSRQIFDIYFADPELLAGRQENPVIFEPSSQQQTMRIFIAAPVNLPGKKLSNFLITEILPEAIDKIIFDKTPGTGMGKTGEAYLVGSDGLMRSPSRFVSNAVLNVQVNTEGFLKALGGSEGVGIYKDYRGVKILGAYGSLEIGRINRIILAEIDSDEAMVPLAAIRNEILLLSLIIVLVIFAVAWFVAYGLTRPLVRLKNAVNFIALGNYDQQLEVSVNDEIGELTRAFNSMATEIKSTTKELKENEERLRHFYMATLDGIILHENDSMILFNSAILNLTGYDEIELSGFRVSDILLVKKVTGCEKDSFPNTFETKLIRKDRTALHVEVQESCIDFEGKNIRASVIRDISARKNIEAELFAERNKRIRAVFDGQDIERQRLSRELHDGLGQQLVAGKMNLESALYEKNADFKARIADTQRTFDQIIGDIRRISHDLSPSVLHEFGLRAAMENLCKNMMKSSGMHLDFSFGLEEENPDGIVSTYLFRIAQESLNNVQRHSGATDVRVVLTKDQTSILLEIDDNGCGFKVKDVAKKGGNGLYNIRERVNILKGSLSIQSKPGKGTNIKVHVPLSP